MTTIGIHRFGPISGGEIELSPLTILVGPNGSGKSYAAMILHSLSKSEDNGLRGSRILPFTAVRRVLKSFDEEDQEHMQELGLEFVENHKVKIDQRYFNKIIDAYFELIFENQLSDKLEQTFATDLSELIREGKHRSFRFDISNSLGNTRLKYYYSYDGIQTSIKPHVDKDVIIDYKTNKSRKEFHEPTIIEEFSNELVVEFPRIDRRNRDIDWEDMIRFVIHFLQTELDFKSEAGSHFLPAGRAGLLQSHEILTTSAFDRLSRVGLEPIEVPAWSGVVSDYLSKIVTLGRRNVGDLAPLADQLEEDTVEGKIKVKTKEERPHPVITLQQHGKEFQLHLASTSISELSPLILFTRYILTKGSTVVIEEPEAHLHPENQRKVAYFIARLVKNGVRVIVTTHSDFLIEQLNNSIRVSDIEEKRKNEIGLNELPAIEPEDVSLHIFKGNIDEGYKISKVQIDEHEGIPLTEFDRVSDELYGEAIKVDNLLSNNEGDME